jgi:lipopolysaccharide/colanic/teichoic acid biosynthesis glycosyltransferase
MSVAIVRPEPMATPTKKPSLEPGSLAPSAEAIQQQFQKIKTFFYLKDLINRKSVFKRPFDILFSLSVLLLFSPLYAGIFLAIKVLSPEGSVFYGQKRLGRNGATFRCFKFRTMVPNAEARLQKLFQEKPELRLEFMKDFKLKQDPRIIPGIGHFLRKTSLDELPQFWNVFIGDMSVVGPRPIVPEEAIKYGKYVMHLFLLRPGITGPWQTGGRNDTSYRNRIAQDLLYIKNLSFLRDLKIVAKTVYVMLARKGAY